MHPVPKVSVEDAFIVILSSMPKTVLSKSMDMSNALKSISGPVLLSDESEEQEAKTNANSIGKIFLTRKLFNELKENCLYHKIYRTNSLFKFSINR